MHTTWNTTEKSTALQYVCMHAQSARSTSSDNSTRGRCGDWVKWDIIESVDSISRDERDFH